MGLIQSVGVRRRAAFRHEIATAIEQARNLDDRSDSYPVRDTIRKLAAICDKLLDRIEALEDRLP